MHDVLIIGCGNIAGGFDADRPADAAPLTHAGAFTRHGGFRITACVDPDAAQRAAFQTRWGVDEGAANLEALGTTPGRFAAISICSPTAFHRAHIEAAVALRPRLIFCEKPVAKTAEETRALAESCATAGIALAVNYTRRWDPVVAELAEELRSGAWGQIRSVSGVYTKGVVHNGGHMVDLLHLLLGEISLVAAGAPRFDFEEDDPSVSALLTSAAGVPIALSIGDASDYALFELTLVAERGTVTMLDGGRRWALRRAGASEVFAGYCALGPPELRDGGYDEAMLSAITNLADELDYGATLASDGFNALDAQILCESIRAAALATHPSISSQRILQ